MKQGAKTASHEELLKYGNRTPTPTFWCIRCNVPLLQEKCERCDKKGLILSKNSLRPVFEEELNIIRRRSQSRSKWFSLADFSFWAAKRDYFYNGQKVFSVRIKDREPLEIRIDQCKTQHLPKKQLKPETIIERIKKANRSSLNKLEYQAIEFIEKTVKTFNRRLPIVSFSGGKDSSVVSHLVRLALGPKIIHIFGDTTIEYPDTYRFIEEFKKNNPGVPFLTAKPIKDFFEVANEIGPPSRILRWCCTTHKTGPIGQLKTSLNGDGVLGFIGNRRAESSRRSKYKAIMLDNKMAKEIASYPILSWNDTELWLYIFTRHINFNESYRYGSTRVGCLYCPFNSEWSYFISMIRYKNKFKIWENFLLNYTKKSKIHDPDIFIAKSWRFRGGGTGYNSRMAILNRNECMEKNNAYNYELSQWDERFFEYLKPLGKLLKIHDDGVIAIYSIVDPKTNELLFNIKVSRPRKHLRIVVFPAKNNRLLMLRIENQIKRFQSCILCGQCQNVCKVGAFSSLQEGIYKIDENICVNCMECIKKPCLAQKSLRDYRE